jgi:hypothetical protein
VGLREEQELIFDRLYHAPSDSLWRPAASGPVRKVGDTQEVAL